MPFGPFPKTSAVVSPSANLIEGQVKRTERNRIRATQRLWPVRALVERNKCTLGKEVGKRGEVQGLRQLTNKIYSLAGHLFARCLLQIFPAPPWWGVSMCFLVHELLRKLGTYLTTGQEKIELTLENSGLTEDQIHKAKMCLKYLKLEGKRYNLSRLDLLQLCYVVGMNPSEDVIESKLREMNLSGATFVHFAHLWFQLMLDTAEEDEILRRAFFFFDKDGNGEVSVQELKHTMAELGGLLRDEEIDLFVSLMDVNNNGTIEYGEFIRTLKSQLPAYFCSGLLGGVQGSSPAFQLPQTSLPQFPASQAATKNHQKIELCSTLPESPHRRDTRFEGHSEITPIMEAQQKLGSSPREEAYLTRTLGCSKSIGRGVVTEMEETPHSHRSDSSQKQENKLQTGTTHTSMAVSMESSHLPGRSSPGRTSPFSTATDAWSIQAHRMSMDSGRSDAERGKQFGSLQSFSDGRGGGRTGSGRVVDSGGAIGDRWEPTMPGSVEGGAGLRAWGLVNEDTLHFATDAGPSHDR